MGSRRGEIKRGLIVSSYFLRSRLSVFQVHFHTDGKRRSHGRILTKRCCLQLWQIQSGSLSLVVSQGIELGSLWHEKAKKSLTQGRSETVQGSTVNAFSPSGDSNLTGMVAAPTPPFLPYSATDETFSF